MKHPDATRFESTLARACPTTQHAAIIMAYADLRLKETVWKNGSPGKAYQCATATQRAEAFLRTIGKWRGE